MEDVKKPLLKQTLSHQIHRRTFSSPAAGTTSITAPTTTTTTSTASGGVPTPESKGVTATTTGATTSPLGSTIGLKAGGSTTGSSDSTHHHPHPHHPHHQGSRTLPLTHHGPHHPSPLSSLAQQFQSPIRHLRNHTLGDTEGETSSLSALGGVVGAGLQGSVKDIELIQVKITKIKEQIKEEQTTRDENVNEYLKLSSVVEDKNQLTRLKKVFEKKNQKSAQEISKLQKKLDSYTKKLESLTKKVQGTSANSWQVNTDRTRMLRDLKDGVSGLSSGIMSGLKSGLSVVNQSSDAMMSKPKEFFKYRFGSTDNIPDKFSLNEETQSPRIGHTLGTDEPNHSLVGSSTSRVRGNSIFYTGTTTHTNSHSTKHTSDDDSSLGSGSVPTAPISTNPRLLVNKEVDHDPIMFPQTEGPNPSRVQYIIRSGQLAGAESSNSATAVVDLERVITELRDRRQECQILTDEVDTLKQQYQSEVALFQQLLQEERDRFERLEEQLNDLIDLHQNEIENLKQGVSDMEEKVQYQSEERLRDVYEMLESCQTRISRMEHQQHQHLQQLVNLDSFENSNAKQLFLKLINVVLTVLQVILLLVATVANVLAPFMQTRVRILSTMMFIMLLMGMYKNWTSISAWLQSRLIEKFPDAPHFIPFLGHDHPATT